MAKKPTVKPNLALEALNEAIDALGGPVKAAARWKVTLAVIYQWRKKGVPPLRVPLVSDTSGVDRKRLRPELYA